MTESLPSAPEPSDTLSDSPESANEAEKAQRLEEAGVTKDEIREAARILKTKGTKKRERRKAAGVMGLVGGSLGGRNRASNLTPEQRTEIARLGGLARQALAREERAKRAAKQSAKAQLSPTPPQENRR